MIRTVNGPGKNQLFLKIKQPVKSLLDFCLLVSVYLKDTLFYTTLVSPRLPNLPLPGSGRKPKSTKKSKLGLRQFIAAPNKNQKIKQV